MIRDKKIILQDVDFVNIIEDNLANEKVQEMKKYRQHHKINCLDHCLFVSYNAYIICKKHDLDYISTARAAMVHDLFLYDWRKRQPDRKGLHAFTHGKTACENASKLFDLNDKEKDIIRSIRDDERKHNQILRELYYDFTGQILPADNLTNSSNNQMSYKENLEKALFGELDAIKKYRKIMGTMPSGKSYTLLMSIMTDEIRHANKYNFLIQMQK